MKNGDTSRASHPGLLFMGRGFILSKAKEQVASGCKCIASLPVRVCRPKPRAKGQQGGPMPGFDCRDDHFAYCPRSNTLTAPSPPEKYRYSVSLPSNSTWRRVILITPLTSFAAPVSSSLKLQSVSASCAKLRENQACCFSKGVVCSLMRGSSAAKVTMAACVL